MHDDRPIEPLVRAQRIIDEIFAESPRTVLGLARVDGGRGVFSEVERCVLSGAPHSVVIKHARRDANGRAAIAAGAYRRESIAYETVLPATSSVARPGYFGSTHSPDGGISFVLEDLSDLRAVDQIAGLRADDVRRVAKELIELHTAWSDRPELDALAVRRATPSHLAVEGLTAGLQMLDEHWRDLVSDRARAALHLLVERRENVVGAFVAEGGQTLCHGDPRADNVVFAEDDRAVLFDWQQMAVQFGEADLAWLLSTSTTPETRRDVEADVIASYALARGQNAATTWERYRLGMVLPGLAVLFLAQRETADERTEQLIATSLERIGIAVDDLAAAELRT